VFNSSCSLDSVLRCSHPLGDVSHLTEAGYRRDVEGQVANIKGDLAKGCATMDIAGQRAGINDAEHDLKRTVPRRVRLIDRIVCRV